jgi:hypothetical protein
MYLFLDDLRYPRQAMIYKDGKYLREVSGIDDTQWHIVRDYKEFVNFIETRGIPEVVSFDHDLCFEHIKYYYDVTKDRGIIDYDVIVTYTGYQCAQYLVELCRERKVKLPKWYIHSANKIGAENIRKVLEGN